MSMCLLRLRNFCFFGEHDSTLVVVVDLDCFLFCYFTNLTHKYLEPNRFLRSFR